ncbi:helix-turn-helix transcriptional regulator [Flavobacterium sp. SH_e]|uniref:helix-turn-helix domain-containing protein n=1 Tax=Flavobacterium TaxID=237 RepID=UPI0021E4CCA9|nr:helix-turn-helix transcriptional regulator [Flavobacterium sp. SH_e]MCV2486731.1 helix-turn-helix transcriptional regulator [Flavobacterium sp. SH_e]
MSTAIKPKHIGRNISRIRELRDMKQEALAIALGVSQQTISIIEGTENVDEEKLKKIAEVLGVPADVIRNFSEEAVFNIMGNSYDNGSSSINHNNCTFNPLDKLLEVIEKNERLYERLVEAEKEKVALLEKLLDKK